MSSSGPQGSLPVLPAELWSSDIFSTFGVEELSTLALVCRLWRTLAWESLTSIDLLTGSEKKQNRQQGRSESLLRRAVIFRCCRALSLTDQAKSRESWVRAAPNVTRLQVSTFDLPGLLGSKFVVSFRSLRELAILITDPSLLDDWAVFEGLGQLRRLVFVADSQLQHDGALHAPKLTSIATHCTLLEELTVGVSSKEDVALLKPLAQLKYLYVFPNPRNAIREELLTMVDAHNLTEAQRLIKTFVPPSVGLRFGVWNGMYYHNVLLSALSYTSSKVLVSQQIEAVLDLGFDFLTTRTISDLEPGKMSLSHLFASMDLFRNAAGVKALLTRGYPPASRVGSRYGTTIFEVVLTRQSFVADGLLDFLFGAPWESARKSASVEQLLDLSKEEPLVFKLVHQVIRYGFLSRLEYVLSKPQLFGASLYEAPESTGCDLLHHTHTVGTTEALLVDFKMDWRLKDKAGRNAIECGIYHNRADTVTVLMMNLNRQEFLEQLRGEMMGVFGSSYLPLDGGPYCVHRVIKRFVEVVPFDRWKPLVTAWVQLNLRLGSGGSVITTLFQWPDARLVDLCVQAILLPWNPDVWAGRFDLDEINGRQLFAMPTLHLLGQKLGMNDLFFTVVAQAQTSFGGIDTPAYLAWINQTDPESNLTCLLYAQKIFEVKETRVLEWRKKMLPE